MRRSTYLSAMFDVVIVGGGAAGCVAARRLSESSSRSVLLLEAGPDLRSRLTAEHRDGWTTGSRDFDWGFASEPDDRGVTERLRRGRLLGGTSWMTRFAVRGSRADYDEWEARGNRGWAFDDVLPYFNRLESDAEFGSEPWHGAAGPIPVTRYPHLERTEAAGATMQALEGAGFPVVPDHNAPGAIGAGPMPMSSQDGVRVTTADAYLQGDGAPSNLTIRPDTQVADIVLDGQTAVGVRTVEGELVEAGWVVLCAGTYASPAILMRSGIGPPDALRAVGIAPAVELPGVGANLSDHPGVELAPGYAGPVRDAPQLHTIATWRSSAAPAGGAPDLMLWIEEPSGDPPEFWIEAVLLKPGARGRVSLRSADPTEPPRVELPRVREGADVERLAEGYVRAWEVANRPELRALCAKPPAPDIAAAGDLSALVAQEAYSVPHVVGTCAMGPPGDPNAVVDASGRVHGVDRLSVIDASIIPTPPSGFPHLATVMIAERLSDASVQSLA